MRVIELIKTLRGEKSPTAESLRKAIAETEAHRVANSQKLDELAGARAAALLGGDEVALEKIEDDLTGAARELDHADIALVELRNLLSTAQAAERQREFDGLRDRALAHQKHGADALRSYGRLAQKIQPLILAAAAHKEQLRRINDRLKIAGQSPVPDPEVVISVRTDGQVTPMIHKLTLPNPLDGFDLVWPMSHSDQRIAAEAEAERQALADVAAELGK